LRLRYTIEAACGAGQQQVAGPLHPQQGSCSWQRHYTSEQVRDGVASMRSHIRAQNKFIHLAAPVMT
jgi:hypothetical protein